MTTHPPLVVRWTIGDVSDTGFETLRLSIAGAHRVFGGTARFVVCVNTIDAASAGRRVGTLPCPVEWRSITSSDIPSFLRARLDGRLAEGTGWKFAPIRVAGGSFELALDNDCILWAMPAPIRLWLDGRAPAVLAEDVLACFGRFAGACGSEPRNSGIRGLAPTLPFAAFLQDVLASTPGPLESELDEQGLQVAALRRHAPPLVVTTDDVAICSPFHPHQRRPGACGVHMVGVNVKQVPWLHQGRPGSDWIRENWERLRPEVQRHVGWS